MYDLEREQTSLRRAAESPQMSSLFNCCEMQFGPPQSARCLSPLKNSADFSGMTLDL
jgi:hypothetical protein